jgi:hypothetical protein
MAVLYLNMRLTGRDSVVPAGLFDENNRLVYRSLIVRIFFLAIIGFSEG